MWLILLLYAFFASTFTIGKEAIMHVPPLFFITIRMVIAGALLLGFVKFRDHLAFKIKREHYKWFAAIVLFHIYFSYSLEFVSLKYITSAKACLLYSLSPFITAVFSYIYFKEVMTPKKWAGLIIGFLGFLPVMIASAPVVENTLGSLFTSRAFEVWPPVATLMKASFIGPLVLLILIGNFLCFNLQGYLLHIYTATLLSFFGFITPLIAALFDWLWFGQSVSPSFYITVVLVSFGLYLFYQEELKQGYIAH